MLLPVTIHLSAMTSSAVAASCSAAGVKEWPKAHTSAVVIIPPESCWPQIQDIRSKHDRAYRRWMPHINLLYPFIMDDPNGEAFSAASDILMQVLAEMAPFWIRFDVNSFRFFKHGKNCTLWLKPQSDTTLQSDGTEGSLEDYSNMHDEVLSLQRRLQETFPNCSDLSTISDQGFTPHLSLGQFRPHSVESFVSQLRSNWTEIVFQVTDIALISRSGRDDPFVVRKTVPLAKSV